MDAFQKNALNEKCEGEDMFCQSFALMGYLKNNESFVKRMGYMLLSAKIENDNKWHIYFYFQGVDNRPHCWTSDVIDIADQDKNIKLICETIAYIENYGFHVLTTGKILGIHFEDMPLDWQRKIKINGI